MFIFYEKGTTNLEEQWHILISRGICMPVRIKNDRGDRTYDPYDQESSSLVLLYRHDINAAFTPNDFDD